MEGSYGPRPDGSTPRIAHNLRKPAGGPSDRPPHVPRWHRCGAPRRAARSRDFLWCMSSDLLLTLSQLLARHGRQVVLLVVRDLAVPHDEDDLQPFRPQRPERLVMRVAPRPLLVVVRAGP